jgi:tetratricopeptide (TPR) repeat protein
LRAIRFSLSEPQIFLTQLRAILRAVPADQCRVMLPMIADLSDYRAVKAMLDAEKAALGIDADLPEAHNNLGNLFRLQRKHAQAFRHIQRALQLRPDYADAQANWDELRQEVPRLFRATPAEPLSCPPGVEAVVAVSAARKAPAKAPLRARRTPRAHAQPEIVTVPVPVTTAPARASASAGAGARPADGKARAGKHATRQSVCAHEGRK